MRIQNLREFSLLSVAGTVSLMPLLVLPAMIGVLVDESALSEPFAGLSASVNFAGGALVSMLMALRMHGIELRRVAAAALLGAAGMDVVSAFATGSPALFLLARFAAGVGAGAAYTCIVAAFARYADLDRGYGLFVTLQFIVSGIGLYLLPVHASRLGSEGMFLSIAALELLSIALVRELPGRAVPAPAARPGVSERGVLLAPATLFAVVSFGLFEAANTAQFTYIERLGAAIALPAHEIGGALLVASLAGIPGAFATVLLGERFGRVGPLSFGIALAALGVLVLMSAEGLPRYVLGGSCLGFTWAFCLPFIQGLMASLDRGGSALAAGASASTIGGAAGPGLAAFVVGDGHYQHVFLAAVALFAVALAGFVASGARIGCAAPETT